MRHASTVSPRFAAPLTVDGVPRRCFAMAQRMPRTRMRTAAARVYSTRRRKARLAVMAEVVLASSGDMYAASDGVCACYDERRHVCGLRYRHPPVPPEGEKHAQATCTGATSAHVPQCHASAVAAIPASARC